VDLLAAYDRAKSHGLWSLVACAVLPIGRELGFKCVFHMLKKKRKRRKEKKQTTCFWNAIKLKNIT